MILIVGLGNPGEKYKKTRHNVGFMVLDEFQKIHGFSDWQLKKKFKAEISEGIINAKKIILAEPQTFMNESGKAVKTMKQETRDKRQELWVVHDDIDLELGKMKIVQNRGSAGHKGVQSIIDELGTKNFARFRVGIKNKKLGIQNIENFVLKKFTKEEEKVIEGTVQKTCQAIEFATKQGIEKTMGKYN
ncbi:aminoacyl-tRNA hydrolase [Candidatus Parcubacteria bacterium]|nr:aminoacyl-tRNA hydrolase [Candidatus Parcubacteria bacterium]